MASLPKFESKLQDKIAQPGIDQMAHDGYGIVLGFDSNNNTATVLMSNKGSDAPGQTYTNVPCPTSIGVQMVAPDRGRPCWIAFKDSSYQYPIITAFFNPIYSQIDYTKQTQSITTTPRFMFQT